MNPEKNLKMLLSRIEGCLQCYEEFKDYDTDDRLRIRAWYNEDIGSSRQMKTLALKVSLAQAKLSLCAKGLQPEETS